MRSIVITSLFLAPVLLQGQDKVTYQDHVRPVFENRCLNCHNPDKKKGGLDLSTYAGTLAGGSGGMSVDAGDANSALIKCIKFEKEPFMPPKSDKIFFVARGDGSSEFSRTLDEHNRAVAKYILKKGG